MLFKRFKHIYLLLITILVLVFFSHIIFNPSSMFFPSQDIVSIFSQEKDLFSDTVKTYKTLPLWNPYIFSGSPFLGNPTSSMFYPFNLIFLIFPTDNAFGYMYILNSILLGFFMYLFAKTINLSKFSSFTSGIIMMFGGPMLTQIFPGHLVNLDTFIWFPLILTLYELAIRKQKVIYAFLASFPIALSLLAGASQIAVFSLLSVSIYYFIRILMSIPTLNKFLYFRKAILIFIIPILLGFLLAAVQLLPTNEFSKLSARANGLNYEFASDFSLHPKQLASFLLPYFFGDPKSGTYWGKGNFWELNGYLGVLPLFFAFTAIIYKKSKHAIILSILGIFALLFSLGKFFLVFPVFYDHVPFFNSFRVPARFLYVYAFSISVLAGIGLDLILKKINNSNVFLRKTKFILLVGLGLLSIVLFLIFNGLDTSFYEKLILNNSYAVGLDHNALYQELVKGILLVSILLICFSVLILLKIKNKINLNLVKLGIVLILVLDLWVFNSKIITTNKINNVYKTPQFIKEMTKDNETFRVFDKDSYYLPLLEKNKIENITGVHSLYIKDYQSFLLSMGPHENKPYESFFEINEINSPIFLDLLNTKYILSNKEIKLENLKEISEHNNVEVNYLPKIEKKLYIYKNTNVLPRAYIVPNAIIMPENKILDELKKENFNPKEQIILSKNPNAPLSNLSSFENVEANLEPNKITLQVDLKEPGFLVLSEVFYPGWKVYDNDKETEIYKTNYILRSIYLNKGIHKVTFSYSPESYRIGLIISLSTLLLLLLYLLRNRKGLVDIKRLFS